MENEETYNSIAFSPDGKQIVTSHQKGYRIWYLATGLSVNIENHLSIVKCAVYSPDSRYIASGGYDGTVRLFDTETKKTKFVFRVPKPAFLVKTVAFSPDGSQVICGGMGGHGYDQNETIWAWHTLSGTPLFFIKDIESQKSFVLKYNATGEKLFYANIRKVLTWDVRKINMAWTPDRHKFFSANGKAVLRTLVLGLLRLGVQRVDPACLEMEIFSGLFCLDV